MTVSVLERTLPAALEAERSVLGAILLHSDAFHAVASLLTPNDFFRDAHRRIFSVMVDLPTAAIDLVTVKDALVKHGSLDEVGGPAYLASLADGMPRASNVESYAAIIKDKAVARGIIFAANKSQAAAYEGSDEPTTIIDAQFAELLTLSQHATGPGFQRVGLGLSATLEQIEELGKPDSIAWGERTDLTALDRIIRGLRPAKFIVIAARPSVGKTSLALNISKTVAKRGKTVGVFSLEMDRAELNLQLVSSEASVNIEDLSDGKLDQSDWQRVSQAFETLNTIPLYIDDATDLTPLSLRAKARRLQIEHGLSLLVVDYLQLMRSQDQAGKRKFANREEELAAMSRGFKLLAKDLKVPVIVCAQLNRASEARDDKRPQLADLRGSGAIEQDADTVILLHRADMYPAKKGGLRRKTAAVVQEEIERGTADIIVAKNRGGNTGTVKVIFAKETTTFRNLAL